MCGVIEMSSKVYFTNMRTEIRRHSLLFKLKNLMKVSGFESIDFKDKFVAVKIHFGEPGNMAFLRPNWSKVVCDYVKELGGKPFLTDCNTLYVGKRKNALEHLESAYTNGYNPFQTGVHTIIADGLKGTDEAYIPLENTEFVKEAKIGRALADADIIISLSHFKGHISTGFGGALKNLGMGGGSRAGKMEMHSQSKPTVKQEKCIGCGACIRSCAHGAPKISGGKCTIDLDRCVGCGRCIGECPKDAIMVPFDEAKDMLNKKIAEYALAVVKGKPHYHISLAIDISPHCDCHSENDLAIVPNIGMFASFDPVAIDIAAADAVNAEAPLRGSLLADVHASGECEHTHDHFKAIGPKTNWRAAVIQGQKIGLGSQEYELIKI